MTGHDHKDKRERGKCTETGNDVTKCHSKGGCARGASGNTALLWERCLALQTGFLRPRAFAVPFSIHTLLLFSPPTCHGCFLSQRKRGSPTAGLLLPTAPAWLLLQKACLCVSSGPPVHTLLWQLKPIPCVLTARGVCLSVCVCVWLWRLRVYTG